MHTDGNDIAGLLEEIFGCDMTGSERVCQSCRAQRAIGSHRLYHGAGAVLRCPECGDLAACIVAVARGHAVTLSGTWLFATSR